MSLLDIEQDVRDVAVVVCAKGEVDSSTVDTLAAALESAIAEAAAHPARVLVIELDHVTYFGSAGLNALLGCSERGGTEGVAVRLVASNAEVVRPIRVTRLENLLRPYQNIAEALTPSDGPK